MNTVAAAGIQVKPVSPAIGSEVSGVDLSQPLSDAEFRQIEQAWHDGLILLFHGQHLEEEEQVRFAERFGTLAGVLNKHTGRGHHPSVMYISNIRENGQLIGALPDGEYRISLSGSLAIYDTAGNPLDGDANGTPGGDYVRFFRCHAPPPHTCTSQPPLVTAHPLPVLPAGIPRAQVDSIPLGLGGTLRRKVCAAPALARFLHGCHFDIGEPDQSATPCAEAVPERPVAGR